MEEVAAMGAEGKHRALREHRIVVNLRALRRLDVAPQRRPLQHVRSVLERRPRDLADHTTSTPTLREDEALNLRADGEIATLELARVLLR